MGTTCFLRKFVGILIPNNNIFFSNQTLVTQQQQQQRQRFHCLISPIVGLKLPKDNAVDNRGYFRTGDTIVEIY